MSVLRGDHRIWFQAGQADPAGEFLESRDRGGWIVDCRGEGRLSAGMRGTSGRLSVAIFQPCQNGRDTVGQRITREELRDGKVLEPERSQGPRPWPVQRRQRVVQRDIQLCQTPAGLMSGHQRQLLFG